MTRYVLIKILRSIFTLWIVVSAVFLVLRVSGDPVYSIFSLGTPESTLDVFRAKWGIDKTIFEQYVIYLGDILRGDFGTSFFDGQPAWDLVMERLPKTLLLGGTTFGISVVAGVSLGALAALKRGTAWDRGYHVRRSGLVLHAQLLSSPVADSAFFSGIALVADGGG
ncbi:MAG: ABC transporter permease [Paracoccaceae bacterium]